MPHKHRIAAHAQTLTISHLRITFFKHEIIQIPKAQLNRQKYRQKEHVSDVFLRSHRIQRDLQSTKQNENPQATTRTAAEIQQNA
jgi:hypothetical protein